MVDIREISFDFALDIVRFYKMCAASNEYVLSKQLLRSGTSIGANVEEAQAAQSKKDFIAKMSIASKEARETKYWLHLIKESELLNSNNEQLDGLVAGIDSVINILTKIVKISSEKHGKTTEKK